MYVKQDFTRNEKVLFWTAVFITGFGWGAAGYCMKGIGCGISCGLIGVFLIIFCLYRLDSN